MQEQKKALRILWEKKKGAKTRNVLEAQCSEHSVWERPAFFQDCFHFAPNVV